MKVSKIITTDQFKSGVFEALNAGYKPDETGIFAIIHACNVLHVRCTTPATKKYQKAVDYAILLIEDAQSDLRNELETSDEAIEFEELTK